MALPSTKVLLIRVSLLLYALSLVLPSLTSPETTMRGWEVLLIGVMGYVVGEFRWFANPLFFIAVASIGSVKYQRSRGVISLVTIAVLLSASCLVIQPHVGTGGSSTPRTAEATLEVGAYVWIIAHIALLLAALCSPRNPKADLANQCSGADNE
jgi:hypothetical protein